MAKLKRREISQPDYRAMMALFHASLVDIDDYEQANEYINCLFTTSEKVMIARRIQVARAILADQTYLEIIQGLGAGNTTIILMENFLNRYFCGKNSQLRQIEGFSARKRFLEEHFSLAELKKIYPAHFVLYGDMWITKQP